MFQHDRLNNELTFWQKIKSQGLIVKLTVSQKSINVRPADEPHYDLYANLKD